MKKYEPDYEMIQKFYREVLVPLENDEVFVLQLQARRKYYPIASHDPVTKRQFIRENGWIHFGDKVRQVWTYAYGLCRNYNTKATTDGDQTEVLFFPPQSYTLYVDLSPKSTVKGYILFMKETTTKLLAKLNGDQDIDTNFRRSDVNLYSAIVRSNSRKPYMIIDIDTKDKLLLDTVIATLHEIPSHNEVSNIAWISETHGGYHILLRIYKGAPYWKIINEEFPAQIKDGTIEIKAGKTCMTPLVGTYQGGHLVRGWTYNGYVRSLMK
jgi:hypothetical protein